jgi:hypothetical protein
VRHFGLILIFLISSYLPIYGETVDEVVAAVGNTPILRSDLALAALVRLVESGTDETDGEPGTRLLESRIRLELQFRDLESSGTLYRLDLDVSGVQASLVARAGGDDALAPALAEHGLTEADVDELALRLAAVTAYVEQRLRPRIRVTSEDVKAAYQDLIVAPALDAGEQPPPLESVQDRIHRLLVERSLNDEIEQWLESAAEQNEVTRFHLR